MRAVLPVIVACWTVPAVAQQRDTVVLRPVVVTATRVPMSRDAVPAAVTVLRGEDLVARGIRSVADALRDVVGVAAARAGSYGSQTSLFVRGGESDYVKVLVDGVPVNAPGGAFDFAYLTTDAIDRIEIVRGPVSVLYGSDAVTGVVQIFTRQEQGPKRGSLEAGGGTYGSGRLAGSLAGAHGRVSYTVAASGTRGDGIYPFNNSYENRTAVGALRLTPDAATDLALTMRWGDATAHFPTDGAGRAVDSNQVRGERGPTLGLAVEHRFSPALAARAQLAWHDTDARYDDAPDGPADTAGVYASRSRSETRRTGAGARLDWWAGPATVISGAVDFERQRLRQSGVVESDFGRFGDTVDAVRHTLAYSLQALAGVHSRLSLSAGARLEDNERFGTALTGRAGLSWQLGAGSRVRAAVGTGFKEPSFIEQYGGAGTVGNRDLAPERSRSWEIGIEQDLFRRQVTVVITYFNQRFTDLVEYTFAPAPPDSSNYFNIGGALANGIEASGRWHLGAAISTRLGYAYLVTRVTDPGFEPGAGTPLAAGERLLRRPAHSGHALVAWTPAGRWTLGAEVRVVSAREDLDFSGFPFSRVRLAPYGLVGLTAAADLGRGAWPAVTTRLRFDNLLGARYEEVWGFRAPGRAVVLTLEARLPS